MTGRKTIGEYAKEYLEANGLDSVGWGDVHLLHDIVEHAGLPHRSWRTEKQVLDALERSPLFEKRYFRGPRNRLCRWFVLRDGELKQKPFDLTKVTLSVIEKETVRP